MIEDTPGWVVALFGSCGVGIMSFKIVSESPLASGFPLVLKLLVVTIGIVMFWVMMIGLAFGILKPIADRYCRGDAKEGR